MPQFKEDVMSFREHDGTLLWQQPMPSAVNCINVLHAEENDSMLLAVNEGIMCISRTTGKK